MDSIAFNQDTIAAVATAISLGQGGVAIIRVSGKDAINSCKGIVKTNSKFAWQTHRVFHGFIKDINEDLLIDEILISVMKGPFSFTGEDIVELHCHGGVIIVNRVLNILLSNKKVRIANPGEFSQRAFLNGKIDLTQAEAINQLISSKNSRAAELAFNGVRGSIKNNISKIREKIINQLAEIEARIDFEEDFKEFEFKKFSKNIASIKDEINKLIENVERTSFIQDGVSIALIGKTNTGKSSLINLLSKQNKAIVTEIPGTTRDIIEVNLTIRNIPIKIIDTAGIRVTKDLIENIGIKKSLETIDKTDFIIYLYDLKIGLRKDDEEILRKIPSKKLITIIGNKKDLIDKKQLSIKKKNKNEILMSIKNNQGEDELIEKICKECSSKEIENIDIFLNERQINNLKDCLENLNDTNFITENELPFDLLSIELREAIKNLCKLTGEEITEELLETVFSKFCIGK